MIALILRAGVRSLLRLGGQGGKPPIRRIHDQRRSLGQLSPLHPELVITPSAACSGRVVEADPCRDFPIPFGQFLVRENLFPFQLFWPLQGRRGGVRPYSLEVGVAPRGARSRGLRRRR